VPILRAKPGKDCSTRKGGFAALHLPRVAAAALIDKKALETRKKHQTRRELSEEVDCGVSASAEVNFAACHSLFL
jgi:hypothetical protein